jgi:gliding motility-associated-like protein
MPFFKTHNSAHTVSSARYFLFGFFILFLSHSYSAQENTWTWMKGSNTFNGLAEYGQQGVPAMANTPRGIYECSQWSDLDGNLWIFGGLDLVIFGMYNTLWKYDVSTNMWTWMHGSQSPEQASVYGTQGQFAPDNVPGSRSYGTTCWTDLDGKFWMFGGYGYASDVFMIGYSSELWCYDPAINQWAWMNGPNNFNNAQGSFGTMGVPADTNYPPGTAETNIAWTHDDGTLWMYGGDASGIAQDNMWMYDIPTNRWTWISGTGYNSTSTVNYGTMGVEAPTNNPGPRSSYAAFKDGLNNFYFYGGNEEYALWRQDVWKYNPSNGMWTWVAGAQSTDTPGQCGSYCDADGSSFPGGSFELRAGVGDECGFYLFGGQFSTGDFVSSNLNNLWYFDYTLLEFKLLKGECVANAPGVYGTQGVADAANIPVARNGGSAWLDLEGNFWTFGGNGGDGFSFGNLNDLWKYIPDPDCINAECITSPVVAAFSMDDDEGCVPLTVEFNNNSINAFEYVWSFGDGGTSTLENPTHTYTQTGTYTVILIANGEEDSDTTSQIVNVGPQVNASFQAQINSLCEPFSVELVNTSNNANSYDWFINGELLDDPDSLIFNFTQGEYEFMLIANSEYNCPDTATSSLSLVDCPDIFLFIPNVFTPDVDGFNATFEIQNTGYKDWDLKIFNRWGNMVFESTNSTRHWNGRAAGSDEACPAGTYYYILSVTDFYGKASSFEGHLTLLRNE